MIQIIDIFYMFLLYKFKHDSYRNAIEHFAKSINPDGTVHETYHEKKIGKTLYRITSVDLGKIDLDKALEELIVKKVLREINENWAKRYRALAI